MPFKSEKQRRYLHINKPTIAKAWERKYLSGGEVSKLKLKKVLKAKGGKDAASSDFGGPSGPTGSDNTREQYGAVGQYKGASTKVGDGGTTNKGSNPIVKGVRTVVGKVFDLPLGIATLGLNLAKKISTPQKTVASKTTNIDTTGKGGEARQASMKKSIIPMQTYKAVDTTLINPRKNFFSFKAYNTGGLSGGVRYGPPPKRGPNPQVPPVKMKRGGYKK